MIWYSHLFQNFLEFVVIHTVKGFGIAEIVVFLELSCFFDDPTKVGNLNSDSSGKFGFIVQNEVGQRLPEFCQENALVIANTFSQQHK